MPEREMQVRPQGCAGLAHAVPHRTHGLGLAYQQRAHHSQFVSYRHLEVLVVTAELQIFWLPFVETRMVLPLCSTPSGIGVCQQKQLSANIKNVRSTCRHPLHLESDTQSQLLLNGQSQYLITMLTCAGLIFPSLFDGSVKTHFMCLRLFVVATFRGIGVALSQACFRCSCMSFPHSCAAEARSCNVAALSVALLPRLPDPEVRQAARTCC